MKIYTQHGMALVTALLYLLVITLLVACAFSTGLLQTKISQNVNQEIHAFENAESALLFGESAIQPDEETGNGKLNDATYRFARITRPGCGLYYQVDAEGGAATAKSQLESIMMLPQAGPNPCVDPISPHRVLWRDLEG